MSLPSESPRTFVGRPSLFRSWQVQRRVIGALLLREVITRYGRHNIGFFWLFLEPMLFTLGVMTLWALVGLSHSNFPIAAFAITGYSSILLWRNMPSRCQGAVETNLQLMYHRNVKVIDIYLSRIILEGLGATVSFSVLSTIFTIAGLMEPPEDIATVITAWFLLAWFGASLALTIGALSSKYHFIERIWHIVTYLIFPLSGAGFIVNTLPKAFQDVVLLFPMVHGVEMLREGYFGTAFIAHYDLSYLVLVCLCLTAFGLAMVRITAREVVAE